jgi:uncharacterized membrane protein YgcG
MKRLLFGVLLTLVAALLYGSVAQASVNDFRFRSFEADYYLGIDAEGRSTLKTVERLVAEFPMIDQNHGIERAIPTEYDGHPLSLAMRSIRDDSGAALQYSTYTSGDYKVFRIGDPDRYVQGLKTYELTYEQRDVTRHFDDTGRDEFYWDINGTEWRQPFGTVTARVHIDDTLLSSLTSDIACYQGVQGSTERCQIVRDGDVFAVTVNDVDVGGNVTVAIGFSKGTFAEYQPSLLDRLFRIWIIVLIASSIAAIGLLVWLAYRYTSTSNRSKEMHPITTEYVPPADASVLVSAQIGQGTKADVTAQLIDLAVRHYISITEVSEKSFWKQAEYELKIVRTTNDLRDEEKTFIETLFGDTRVGTVLSTKSLKNNYGVFSKLRKNTTNLSKRIKSDYGLRHEDASASSSLKRISIVTMIVSVLIVSPLLLIAGLIVLICALTIRPLTDKGLELRRYLAGFKNYIELAEKDRIKALQSPEGATKSGQTINDEHDKKLIKLYERTLPYAVLFGQEKQWNEQLALRYEEHDVVPSWYAGHAAFNAAVFTSAMNDFSSSMNSYGASTSSSSGGSTGGGSSGGGGGGGGGGGW